MRLYISGLKHDNILSPDSAQDPVDAVPIGAQLFEHSLHSCAHRAYTLLRCRDADDYAAGGLNYLRGPTASALGMRFDAVKLYMQIRCMTVQAAAHKLLCSSLYCHACDVCRQLHSVKAAAYCILDPRPALEQVMQQSPDVSGNAEAPR